MVVNSKAFRTNRNVRYIVCVRFSEVSEVGGSIVYLKRANHTYLLARSTIQRSTECQYKQICKHTHLTFGLNFDEYGQYIPCLSYNATVAMIRYGTNSRSDFQHSLCLSD